MDDLLTSAEAAKLLGVGTTAIKRWSDSQVLPCIKTGGGHRRFRRSDVERLMMGAGATADGAEWDDWVAALVGQADPHALQARLYGLRAREGAWHRVMQKLGGLVGALGDRWEASRLTVAEEHIASARLERALASLSATLPSEPDAPVCLLATADGDEHTLGLSLAEVCLWEAGWRTQWVGRRTRAVDIAGRIEVGGLSMVALSASIHSTDAVALSDEVAEVGDVCRAARIPLVLGGSAPWPEESPLATRFRDLTLFYHFAIERRGETGRAVTR
jgi:excisionase family DNA binding protein